MHMGGALSTEERQAPCRTGSEGLHSSSEKLARPPPVRALISRRGALKPRVSPPSPGRWAAGALGTPCCRNFYFSRQPPTNSPTSTPNVSPTVHVLQLYHRYLYSRFASTHTRSASDKLSRWFTVCVRLSLHCVPLSSIAVEGGALAPRLACASSASVRRRSLAPHASFVRVVLFDIRCPKAFGVGMRSYRESMVPICARLSCRMLQAGPRRPPMAAIGQSGQCRRIPD